MKLRIAVLIFLAALGCSPVFGSDDCSTLGTGSGSWLVMVSSAAANMPPVTARPELRESSSGDLVELHRYAGIELRVVPKLLELWDDVIASTLEFSGMRLRNTQR